MIKTLYTPRTSDFNLPTPLGEEPNFRDSGGGLERNLSEEEPKADLITNVATTALEDSAEEFDEPKDKRHSRKLRLEDLKPSSHSLGDFFFGYGEMDPLSMDYERGNSVGLAMETALTDWTLPVEAFPLRHEIKDQSPPPEQYPNSESPEPVEGMRIVSTKSYILFRSVCSFLLTVVLHLFSVDSLNTGDGRVL